MPIFLLSFYIRHFCNPNEKLRIACEKCILDTLSKLIATCMNYGNELCLDVWKNVNKSLHVALQETMSINKDNVNEVDAVQQKSEEKVLLKICALQH